MKKKDISIPASIVVLFVGLYFEATILSVIAVAMFFYHLGKSVGADEQLQKTQELNNLSANNQSVTSEEGR